eukprot:723164-Rhodomonas_salina.1
MNAKGPSISHKTSSTAVSDEVAGSWHAALRDWNRIAVSLSLAGSTIRDVSPRHRTARPRAKAEGGVHLGRIEYFHLAAAYPMSVLYIAWRVRRTTGACYQRPQRQADCKALFPVSAAPLSTSIATLG